MKVNAQPSFQAQINIKAAGRKLPLSAIESKMAKIAVQTGKDVATTRTKHGVSIQCDDSVLKAVKSGASKFKSKGINISA
jgi:uncharacterized protein (DUF4415 family)